MRTDANAPYDRDNIQTADNQIANNEGGQYIRHDNERDNATVMRLVVDQFCFFVCVRESLTRVSNNHLMNFAIFNLN